MGTYLDKYIPSYWLQVFQDSEAIYAYLEALQEYSSYKDYLYRDSLKAYACDPSGATRKVPWYPIYLTFNKNTDFQSIRFGDGTVYDGSKLFGQVEKQLYWVLPDNMLDVGVVVDSPINPSQVIFPGEFTVVDQAGTKVLLLDNSVFETSSKVVTTTDDRTLVLWAKQSQWKNTSMFDMHEVPTRFFSKTRSAYAAMALNAAYKSLSVGPSRETLVTFISGITELPICLEDGVVEAISATHVVVGTKSYKLPKGAHTVAVSVGDEVKFGQSIINEFSIVYGQAIGELDSLHIPYLPGSQSHYDTEVLGAAETPGIIGTDSDGYTMVSLNSTGTRVNEFWEHVHALSKSSGKTLAQYLSGVSTPVVPPDQLYPVRALELLAATALSRSFVVVVDSSLVNLENLNLYVPKIQDLAGLGSSVYFKVI